MSGYVNFGILGYQKRILGYGCGITLLANSHTGEDPAREAGPNLRLLEAGRPGPGERSGPFLYFLLCGQYVPGALPILMQLLGPQAPQAPALKL